MFLQAYLASLVLVFCIGAYEASFVLEDSIKSMYRAKYRIMSRPKRTMLAFCAQEPARKLGFSCPVTYLWHQDQRWQELCATAKARWFFPPRYYRIVMQCHIGGYRLKGLRAEWKVFY